MHYTTDWIAHNTVFGKPVVEYWLEREIAQWVYEGSIGQPIVHWAALKLKAAGLTSQSWIPVDVTTAEPQLIYVWAMDHGQYLGAELYLKTAVSAGIILTGIQHKITWNFQVNH